MLVKLGVTLTDQIKEELGDLTFGECEALAADLAKASNPQEALTVLTDVWQRCTLQAPVSQGVEKTWAERCREDAQFNR
jgi:hypothetical protein